MPGNDVKYRGIWFSYKMKGYIAQHKIKRKTIYLGTFDKPEDAAHAYDVARYEAFQKGLIKKLILNFGVPTDLRINYIVNRQSKKPERLPSPLLEIEEVASDGEDWSYLLNTI